MLKYALLAMVAMVFCAPGVAQADCGCGCGAPVTCCQPADPCACPPKTRLKLARVEKEVTRCKRVCVVDECGCAKMERVPVTKCVTRLQMVRVPREPKCCCPTPVCECGCR